MCRCSALDEKMYVNTITIKFKDGSSIYIDDVSDYAINNNVIKVNKNGYNQFLISTKLDISEEHLI